MMSHDNQGQSLDEMQEQLQFTGEEVDCDTHAIFSPSKAPVNECSSPYAESMPRSEINEDSLYMDTYDGDSDHEHYCHEIHSDFEKFDDAPEAEKVADIATSSSQSGYVMGEILANALDAPCDYDTPPSIEMTVNGQLLTYVQYINKQVLEINSKKFFRLTNWETPLLFGYKHFAGIYNSIDKRGYIGYCQLVKCTKPDEPTTSVHRYVLVEIWQTRCWKPHYHLIVYDAVDNDIQLKLHGLTWLNDENLECDPSQRFDLEKVRK